MSWYSSAAVVTQPFVYSQGFWLETKTVLRISLLAVHVCVFVSLATAQEDVLTVGSPAPEFRPEKFLQEPDVPILQHGHKYVIEFSGTSCIPCIQAIPHIEQLKRENKKFTFISVFSEPEEDVRKFLKGPGQKMTSYVACDPKGSVVRDWLRKSRAPGIPFIFVVNEDLTIAWMGTPDKLAPVLAMVAKDGTVQKDELMRVTLMQHASIRQIEAQERLEEARRHLSKDIVKLINEGLHAQAVEALDRAMETYRDVPDMVEQFRTMQFYVMADVPGSQDAAYVLALDIAADHYNTGETDFAGTLVQHYERALPENKNLDLVYLALSLLQETPIPTTETHYDSQRRRGYFSSLAKAHHLLGDEENAREALKEAIVAAEIQVRQQREAGDPNVVLSTKNLARLREQMATYKNPSSAEEETVNPRTK